MADTAVTVPHDEHDAYVAATHLRHHFATPEQQLEASTLGMWTFLVTEVLFFGGIFAAYAIYRSMYPAAFASASSHMEVGLGGLNTIILLASSFTMSMAVRAAQLDERRALVRRLVITIVLGVIFLCIKAFEYHSKYEEHLIPGFDFQYADPRYFHNAQILFFLYFAMTGMHAIHMIIGLGLLAFLLPKAWRGVYTSSYFNPVEMTSLYWHFVDIVWTFIFPLIYLIGHK